MSSASPTRQRLRSLAVHLAIVGALGARVAAFEAPDVPPPPRDPCFAAPLSVPGLPNLHRVSPVLYRGAQPTEAGLRELRKLGVKTVVSLRAFHGEREAVQRAGLDYERISFKVWHPEDEDIRRFIAIASDPDRQPVFVHCLRGADRTGTAVAAFRMTVEGWDRESAITEMVSGGFGFERRFSHLVGYLRRLHVDRLRSEVRAPGRLGAPGRSDERCGAETAAR